jgi:natural product precursor
MHKISLNKIASENLTDRQMKAIKGGGGCYCACCQVSSSYNNGAANASSGKSSPEATPCDGGGYWTEDVIVTPTPSN